jgi:hypothetical protein
MTPSTTVGAERSRYSLPRMVLKAALKAGSGCARGSYPANVFSGLGITTTNLEAAILSNTLMLPRESTEADGRLVSGIEAA